MIKYFLYISLSLLAFSFSFAKNVDIQEDIKIDFVCELEKKIIKNSENNYKTFLRCEALITIIPAGPVISR